MRAFCNEADLNSGALRRQLRFSRLPAIIAVLYQPVKIQLKTPPVNSSLIKSLYMESQLTNTKLYDDDDLVDGMSVVVLFSTWESENGANIGDVQIVQF